MFKFNRQYSIFFLSKTTVRVFMITYMLNLYFHFQIISIHVISKFNRLFILLFILKFFYWVFTVRNMKASKSTGTSGTKMRDVEKCILKENFKYFNILFYQPSRSIVPIKNIYKAYIPQKYSTFSAINFLHRVIMAHNQTYAFEDKLRVSNCYSTQ